MYQPWMMQFNPNNVVMPATSLVGKVVNNVTEITAQDVLQNGTACWFPAADGSCVWRKVCLPNGLIETTAYIVSPECANSSDYFEQNSNSNPDRIAAIEQKLDEIIKVLEAKNE